MLRQAGRARVFMFGPARASRVFTGVTSLHTLDYVALSKSSFTSIADSAHPEPTPLGDGAFANGSIYESRPEMTYGGALSFLRRTYSKNIFHLGDSKTESADVVVSGIPYDGAVTYRSGARLGPRGIREASVQLAELKPFPWGFNPFERLGVVDFGDALLDPHRPASVVGSIEAHARAILSATPDCDVPARLAGARPPHTSTARASASGAAASPWVRRSDGRPETHPRAPAGTPQAPLHLPPRVRMLTFGGDHFVTYPLLRAHAAVHGPLSLLHFDAHCDTWESAAASGDATTDFNHGTMFRRAALEGLIDPATSIQVGIRTHNDDFMGFTVLSAPWVHKHGPDAVLNMIRERMGAGCPEARRRPVYLTFDVDCLDPAHAPGTGTPVAGGLTSAQALEIIRGLADPALGVDVVGADIVEVAPAYDHAELTSLAAAHIATDILCGWATQKGRLESQ